MIKPDMYIMATDKGDIINILVVVVVVIQEIINACTTTFSRSFH